MKKIHAIDDVLDAQKMFRLLLDAMSNPGKKVSVRPYAEKMFGQRPAFLAIALTLLDSKVTFCAPGDDVLTQDITSLTLSRTIEPTSADYIFISDNKALQTLIEAVSCGTLRDPHKSATVIVAADISETVRLRLSGPGIKDTIEISAPVAVRAALEYRDAQFYEYPQGIDFFFVSPDGVLFAVPRLTRWEA